MKPCVNDKLKSWSFSPSFMKIGQKWGLFTNDKFLNVSRFLFPRLYVVNCHFLNNVLTDSEIAATTKPSWLMIFTTINSFWIRHNMTLYLKGYQNYGESILKDQLFLENIETCIIFLCLPFGKSSNIVTRYLSLLLQANPQFALEFCA